MKFKVVGIINRDQNIRNLVYYFKKYFKIVELKNIIN